MDTLDYIAKKYSLDLSKPSPIEIPNVGRNDLANWLHELDFKVGVEVGVAEGIYSEIICNANPQMQMIGIDPWLTYVNYTDYTDSNQLSNMYNLTLKRLNTFPNYKIIKAFSMDAVTKFQDNSLDLVYIDANHGEPYVTQDITEWFKKIKPNGIIAGHDYTRPRNAVCHVVDAVNSYTTSYNIKPWFLLGLKKKIPNLVRDHERSWMWIKR